MGKYSGRRSRLDFRNPGSLVAPDDNPCRSLSSKITRQSPELRLDADLHTDRSLALGYSHADEDRRQDADIGSIDPATGTPVFSPRSNDTESGIDTAYFELRDRGVTDLRTQTCATVAELVASP